MTQLYIFQAQADKALANHNGSYTLSSCDIERIDRGASDQAEHILQTAMGEVACYRDNVTGEVLVAWWQEDEAYECELYGHFVSVTCRPDGSLDVDCDGDIDEDEAAIIAAAL